MLLKSLIPLSRKAHRGHLECESSGEWPQTVFHIVLWILHSLPQKKKSTLNCQKVARFHTFREFSGDLGYLAHVYTCLHSPTCWQKEQSSHGTETNPQTNSGAFRIPLNHLRQKKEKNRLWDGNPDSEREIRCLMCVSHHFFDTQVDVIKKPRKIFCKCQGS